MQKTTPTLPRIAVMAVFALSCFLLLLYLWTAFGGPAPLKPQGYRFQVAFDEATQLSEQAEVRISGVPVGKVVVLERTDEGRTLATIEMRSRYAPVSSDARAILRLKTLLGETFVELAPGSSRAPKIPEGGRLATSQVAPTVELDEVLRGFDADTRADLKTWVTGWADALEGRGRDISDVVGNLAPTAERGATLLGILDEQARSVQVGTRETGRIFAALGRREAAARTLVTSGERVLRTTSAQEADLRDVLRILPTFTDELRPTLTAVEAFARDAAPVVRALEPVAPLVPPVLRNTSRLAPDLERLFRDLDPVLDVTARGLPATERTLKAALPLLQILAPVARDLAPVADYLGLYRSEFVTVWANVAAATQAAFTPAGGKDPLHYLRIIAPITNEAFVQQQQRLPSNRHNAYLAPGGLLEMATGLLKSFDCSNTDNPATIPVIGTAPSDCKVQEAPLVAGKRTAYPRLERAAP